MLRHSVFIDCLYWGLKSGPGDFVPSAGYSSPDYLGTVPHIAWTADPSIKPIQSDGANSSLSRTGNFLPISGNTQISPPSVRLQQNLSSILLMSKPAALKSNTVNTSIFRVTRMKPVTSITAKGKKTQVRSQNCAAWRKGFQSAKHKSVEIWSWPQLVNRPDGTPAQFIRYG